MSYEIDKNEDSPIEVFIGTEWEVSLVQSLLENVELETCVFFGGEVKISPLDTIGGMPMNRTIGSSSYHEKAKLMVDQFY